MCVFLPPFFRLSNCTFPPPFLPEILTIIVLLLRRLFVDYRHFDAKNITPRFEFGFGLSYTEFQYSALNIAPVGRVDGQDQDVQLEANWLAAKPGPRGVGSSTAVWLHRPVYTVSFTVKNTGRVSGTEVCILSPFCSYMNRLAHAGENPNRYRSYTCISLLMRASRRPSCAASRTWSCSLASRRLSV